jgi:ABC-type branched-subunit amino acid transport system ATPase component
MTLRLRHPVFLLAAGPVILLGIEQLSSKISTLIEHHLDVVLSLADRGVVLDRSRVSHQRPAEPLLKDHEFRKRVLWL